MRSVNQLRVVPCLALALAACAAAPPAGEDPDGLKYQGAASKVLLAANRFEREQGRFPSSPYELVPKYLAQLPDEPMVHIDGDLRTAEFDYSRGWPRPARIHCAAKLGGTQWRCDER